MTIKVFYHVQGEPGEDPSHPNVFDLPGSDERQPKLRDVMLHFPYRHLGVFHFRFRIPSEEKGGYMWLDVTDPEHKVPLTNGYVQAKVLKLGSCRSGTRRARELAPVTQRARCGLPARRGRGEAGIS